VDAQRSDGFEQIKFRQRRDRKIDAVPNPQVQTLIAESDV
jgi:hypothetical protein